MKDKKEKEIKKLMKKRTLLSMLLIGVMAVSLVGCGDDGKTNNNGNNFADMFNPTTTDTAVNGTESNTGDPVTPYEPGASGPTNSQVETPTPEPEKNVITLMSADGNEVVCDFNIPTGYKVVSGSKSNHLELTKDDDVSVKVEIYTGINEKILTALADRFSEGQDSEYRNNIVNNMSTNMGIDAKCFNKTFSSNEEYRLYNTFCNNTLLLTTQEQYDMKAMTIDMTNHNDKETYPTSLEEFYILYYNEDVRTDKLEEKIQMLPSNKMYTIKVTSIFIEDEYDESHPRSTRDDLCDKIRDHVHDVRLSKEDFDEFIESFKSSNPNICFDTLDEF